MPGGIGGQTGGFTRHVDTAGPGGGGFGVAVGQFGIIVEQAAGHHQMPPNDLGVVFAQAPQALPDIWLEFAETDVIGQFWNVFGSHAA